MALTGLNWSAGAGDDLHLLPGQISPRLDQLLSVTAGTTIVRADRASSVGVVMAFQHSFVPAASGCAGVIPQPATGQVMVSGPLSSAPRLLDFLVTATATEVATGATLQTYLRMHIHTGLRRLWLTPDPLSVKVGSSSARFTVLAEFDDGSYGDVTNWSAWTFDASATDDRLEVRDIATGAPVARWSSNTPADLDVDPDTGVLSCSRTTANVRITLRTSEPAALASADAVGAGSWFAGATVEEIDGPGFSAMADVPNVLVIGDGFRGTESAAFAALADKLVAEIYANHRLTPYGLLKDRLNFFRVMLPSREPGVSDWNAIDRTPTGGGTLADAAHVDLSVPASHPANIATPVPNLSRFLLNERDTAFGAVYGDRPRATRFNAMHGIHLSNRRVSEVELDAFLRTLEDPSGTPGVGLGWQRSGKDKTLIVVLARTETYGGANNFRSASAKLIGVSLGNRPGHRIDVAAIGHQIVDDAIPATPHLVAQLLIVHELGHSFDLGDEYGSQLGNPPAPTTIPLGSTRNEANAYANLQTRDKLMNPNGSFDPELTKWSLWPRICKAAVLTAAPPMPSTARFSLQVSGNAFAFAQDDIVRLRTRPLPASVQSAQLRVMTTPTSSTVLEVSPVAGFDPAPFVAKSIVFAPLLDSAGDEVLLVDSSVMGQMVTTRNPLNALSTAGAGRACPDLGEPVYLPVTHPDYNPDYQYSTPAWSYGRGNAPSPPTESAWITGLWERGHGFDCEVYHPTGACLMNVFTYDAGALKSFQFCWVCRYALVDAIDPTKHGDMDKAIDYRYPK